MVDLRSSDLVLVIYGVMWLPLLMIVCDFQTLSENGETAVSNVGPKVCRAHLFGVEACSKEERRRA